MPEYEAIKLIVRLRLEEAANKNGFKLEELPKLSEEAGFAVACQSYATLTRSDLERIDVMTALTRGPAFSRTYRV